MSSEYDELRDYYDSTDLSHLINEAEETDLGDHVGPGSMTAFTVRLPRHILQSVREMAQRDGVTTGAALRSIIEQGVAEQSSDDDVVSVRELRRLISAARKAEAG